ncbi:kti12, chromatin associated [Borealophlyctis nickersoniae]|nr:kti12, chromatin associated [Borealophlyctis nickersoniae]
MPLINLCGIPASGKTRRATELAALLESYVTENAALLTEKKVSVRPQVVVVNDESLNLNKRTAYADATEEKKARAALLSAVERYLTREDIVICDGMNYIKGFRYQLYCVSRALGTPHCVVHCGTSIETAREWNASRPESNSYPPDVFENLCSRFEEPEARNRWDAPLFTILATDATSEFASQIAEAVILRKAPTPNLSTVVKPLTETNYLHEMDRATQDIVDALLEAQKVGGGGREVVVPRSIVKVRLPSRTVTMSELRRLRRQFTNLNKVHTQLNVDKVAEGFVEYINANLG